MKRAPRSTGTDLTKAEAHQSAVIAALAVTGHGDIAGRLARCQHDRQNRQPGRYPWRCHGSGCWQCRRSTMRRWWRGFRIWLAGSDTSLAAIPLSGDPITGTRRLRKGLRDVRDRAARHDYRWADVAMAGVVDGSRVLMLIRHRGIDRDEVWAILERRWPDIMLSDPGNIEPSCRMNVEDAVTLARCRRGIEPLRLVVPPQMAASQSEWDEPMPVIF